MSLAIFPMTSVTDFTDSDRSPTDSPVELRWKGRGRARTRGADDDSQGVRRCRASLPSQKAKRYRRGKRLQPPHLSEVRIGRDTKHEQRRVVVKEPFVNWMVKSELAALTRLKEHPSVVTLLDWYVEKGSTFFVFKYVEGMDLIDWLDTFFRESINSEAEVESEMRPLARRLAAALEYCHKNGVAHRDLKAENVRVNPLTQRVTLIDFGLAFVTGTNMDCEARIGTRDYAAPELLRPTPAGLAVDPFKCDVWAFGVLLHAMTHHRLPFFKGEASTRTLPRTSFSEGLQTAITTLLTEDAQARPAMEGVVKWKWFGEEEEEE
jgi:serine/threonine protein kinase